MKWTGMYYWVIAVVAICAVLGLMLVQAKKSPSELPVTDLTQTASGLQWKDNVVGTGTEATPHHEVLVHYTGTLYPSGKKFDSSLDRKAPFAFHLGKGQVIPGWEEGVNGMKIGGKRTLIIPPELAYGKSGVPPVIPPNATLRFEIELLGVR